MRYGDPKWGGKGWGMGVGDGGKGGALTADWLTANLQLVLGKNAHPIPACLPESLAWWCDVVVALAVHRALCEINTDFHHRKVQFQSTTATSLCDILIACHGGTLKLPEWIDQTFSVRDQTGLPNKHQTSNQPTQKRNKNKNN